MLGKMQAWMQDIAKASSMGGAALERDSNKVLTQTEPVPGVDTDPYLTSLRKSGMISLLR